MSTVVKVEANQKEIKSHKEFSEGNLWKVLLKVMIPTFLMYFSIALYNLDDAIISVWLITDEEQSKYVLEAITAGGIILGLIYATSTLVNVGAEIKYSRVLAKGDDKESQELIGSSFYASFMMGIALTLFTILIAVPASSLMTDSEEAAKAASVYVLISVFWIIPFCLYDLALRFVRVEGKASVASGIAVVGIPVNIVVDIILVWLMQSIAGAAIATVIAEWITFALTFWYIKRLNDRKETNILTSLKLVRYKKDIILPILILGLPFFLRVLGQTVDKIAIQATMVNMPQVTAGADAVADPGSDTATTTSVYMQTHTIIYYCSFGVIQGAASVIAYNSSKGNKQRTIKASLITVLYSLIIIWSMVALFIGIAPWMFAAFHAGDSATWFNVQIYRILMLRLVFIAFTFAVFSFFQTIHETKTANRLTIIQSFFIFFIITLPVYFTAGQAGTYEGIRLYAISIVAAEAIFALICLPLYIRKLRKL